MSSGLGEDGHVEMGGQVELGRGGVLVGNDSIGYREELLDPLPPLLPRAPIIAQPDGEPGKEVGYHATEPTAHPVGIYLDLAIHSDTYFPPWPSTVLKNWILAVKNLGELEDLYQLTS